MRMQEVKVKLKDGKMQLEYEGFQGPECNTMVDIENSLGTILSTEPTQEAYQQVQDLPEFVKQIR